MNIADFFNAFSEELARGITVTIAISSILALLSIVFLQSGIDKITDFSGNFAWLKGHFEKTALRSVVKSLLVVITILELLAGLFCTLGFFQLLIFDAIEFALMGLTFSSISLLCLMFGQRIAKDYPGAGGLVPYFLVVILGFIMIYNF